MNRFYTEDLHTDPVLLTGSEVKHLVQVFRMQPGETVMLSDGCGLECEAVIESCTREAVVLRPGQIHPAETEPAHEITLFQCLPKTGKMETVIQKGTELGMHALRPVLSSRCVAMPGKDYDKKRERYQKVAAEAAMQSRRGCIPAILPLQPLSELDFTPFDTVLLAYEEERTRSLKTALMTAGRRIALLIGPEGGFSADEAKSLRSKGAVSVSLGPRILRTETAGPAAIAQILFALED